jgi:hypothetical protein
MFRLAFSTTVLAVGFSVVATVAGAQAGERAPSRSTTQEPAADSLTFGGRVVPAGTTVAGPVVVAGGDLRVLGTIEGSAIAIAGDVIIGAEGRVTGDAIAAFGSVRNDGQVAGKLRNYTGTFGESVRALFGGEPSASTAGRSPVALTAGWFAVILVIGLGVLVFASPYLSGVVDVLEQSFWRSFLTGIVGELGVLPAILLLVVALAITILGVLLIPFAIVAAVLAVAGLATLGFVAVARLTGEGLSRGRGARLSERGGALQGLVLGLALYMGLWLVAALLSGVPVIGTVLRLVALSVTWVGVTAGFGAALLSRGGTRRDAVVTYAPAPAAEAAWQTPTPITGVIAARRPRPTAETGT